MIDSVMKETRKFNPPDFFAHHAHIKNLDEYHNIYQHSISNPEGFWAEKAEQLDWFKKWHTVVRNDNGFYKWFEGGELNVSYNCLDRHVKSWRRNKLAFIWEGNFGETRTFTYQQLLDEVCKFANVLKKKGVQKGDRVCMYMPMIPELAIACLACARIGAVHSVVFGGFSAESLKDRLQDSDAKVLITSDGGFHGKKTVPLKHSVDEALLECPHVTSVIVVKRVNHHIGFHAPRDCWWHEEMEQHDILTWCEPEHMHSEDSLFILYTSGTTGKPKGVLHTQAGYLLYTYQTFKWIFDHRDEDIFWCTADIGWITGHSYIVYGPLANGATSLMFEGIPTWPDAGKFWEIIQKHRVNVFYTAPTAIRALQRLGDEWPNKYDLSSLRLLGTVGEPINPEAWMWYHNVIGKERCPIVDTWWQTETGGILITPLPGATSTIPGSATLPFPGIEPVILKDDGSEAKPNEGGNLVIKKPWPSMLRTVWKNPQRYTDTYFSKFPGLYFAGDSARKDDQGYFWIMGRLDDVVNVSGHRLGTAEIESALVSHAAVSESAIVPFPHEIKGQALHAFVTLHSGVEGNDALIKELRNHVAKEIGPIAKPDRIQFSEALPKTRSGKIMRRILKMIASGEKDKSKFGNLSTLANPESIDKLL